MSPGWLTRFAIAGGMNCTISCLVRKLGRSRQRADSASSPEQNVTIVQPSQWVKAVDARQDMPHLLDMLVSDFCMLARHAFPKGTETKQSNFRWKITSRIICAQTIGWYQVCLCLRKVWYLPAPCGCGAAQPRRFGPRTTNLNIAAPSRDGDSVFDLLHDTC